MKFDGDFYYGRTCIICVALRSGYDAVKDDPHCAPSDEELRECIREERENSAEAIRDPRGFWRALHAAALRAMRAEQAAIASATGKEPGR